MTDDLYERYKEALRVGHVAVLRGSLEDAVDAYHNAASIAPSRALPHTSLGGVLLRLGHLEEALVEYAAAVARAPHDEGALLGQAEALTIAGQRFDAAQALDHVSEIQEAAGRLPEASDTLRRALELEDTTERSRRQRGLLREIRLSAGDQAAEQLLARALRLRDEPTAGPVSAPRPYLATSRVPFSAVASTSDHRHDSYVQPESGSELELEPEADAEAGRDESPADFAAGESLAPPVDVEKAPARYYVEGFGMVEPRPPLTVEAAPPVSDPLRGVEFLRRVRAAAEVAASAQPEAAVSASAASTASAPTESDEATPPSVPTLEVESREPSGPLAPVAIAAEASAASAASAAVSLEQVVEAVGVMEGAFDTATPPDPVGESQHQPTGDELLVAAEAADAAGDHTALRSLLLWTARAYAREGRFEAGLDATHRLLQRTPGDVDAHLMLVELYVARDWNGLAAEKLALLGRLAELNNDEETHRRLCAVASRAFPNDERLGALCA
jgi:tetratricopeptide (TPR) repeat protein